MQSNKTGLFITVEGGEGSGKTTNMAFIQEYLQLAGIAFEVSREPGGTPLAEEIRDLVLRPREERVDASAELLLIFAARAQHLNEKIRPALHQGKWLVCDRFTDATYAYQGGGRQLNMEHIQQLETLVQNDLRPDAVIVLDVALEVGMERAKRRGALDRMEQENIQFFNRVREVYLQRAAAEPGRYFVINAEQPLKQVQNDLAQVLQKLIERQGMRL